MSALVFDTVRVAHDLPEVGLTTWIKHDKPLPDGPSLRTTAVAILLQDGNVFIGICGCSEKDQFNKKKAFNIAFGRASQKVAHWLRHKSVTPDLSVDLNAQNADISRWINNAIADAKMAFVVRVMTDRFNLLKKKGVNVMAQTV